MKKLHTLFILMAIVALGFTACTKDDSENTTPTPSIIGTWEAQTYSQKGWVNNQPLSNNQGTYKPGQFIIELKADKTYKETHDQGTTMEESRTGTYSITDNKIKITPNGDKGEDFQFVITSDNNTLTLTMAGEEVTATNVYRIENIDVFKRK